MASTPLKTFVPKISDEVPWATAHHITLLYQKLNNVAQAVTQIKSGTTTTNETIQETGGGGGGGSSATVGGINDQSGATAYTTMPSDNGALVILNDASPVAVTLGVAATIPWFCVFANLGAGIATLTPSTGTISSFGNIGGASMTLPGGYSAWVGFDGTDFWAATGQLVPANTPAVTHEWLASYDSTTGAFNQTQPAFSDISGTLATSQLPAAGISLTITTAALTPTGTQGSMTFTSGVLTAQVQAT